MTEKKETKTYRPVEPSVSLFENIPQDQRADGSTQDKANDRKFVYYYLVPKTDEEAQARYGCNLANLIGEGVRNASYRLKFKDMIDAMNERNAGEQEIADAVQGMMDDLSCAPRPKVERVKTAQDAKEKRALDQAAQAEGFASIHEQIEYLKKMAEGKKSKK